MNRPLTWLLFATLSGATMLSATANEATNDPAAPKDRAARAERMKAQFDKRFDAADANHDGKLSRDEAQKMPRVAEHFDEIDTAKTGFVTKEQVLAKMAERRAKK